MELLTINDVMEMLGIGKTLATRLLKKTGCPLLPRRKGGKMLVPKEAFINWMNNGMK